MIRALIFVGGPVLLWCYLRTTHLKNQMFSPGYIDPVQRYMRLRTRIWWFVFGAILVIILLAVYWGVVAEIPQDYADIRDHYKYGSIGPDTGSGIPYWIWWVLPDMFPQHLPEPDRFKLMPEAQRNARAAYAQFGFVYEEGHDLPIGFSTRKLYVNRVGLNCAVCHVATVRVTEGMDPTRIYGTEPEYASSSKDRVIILGMPSITVDLGAMSRSCLSAPMTRGSRPRTSWRQLKNAMVSARSTDSFTSAYADAPSSSRSRKRLCLSSRQSSSGAGASGYVQSL